MAVTTTHKTNELIAKTVSKLDSPVKGSLKSISNIKSTIRRVRRASHNVPRNPISLNEIFIIPENLKLTISGKRFLLHDDENFEERIIILASDEGISLLRSQIHWYCDGTFKTCPLIFAQSYSIHVNLANIVVPVIYALLPNRSKIIYNRMWEYIRMYASNLSPFRIVLDFEKAAKRSISETFPLCRISGCYFHLSQNLWRKIQSLPDMINKYKNEPKFTLYVRMFLGLSFVPPSDVVLAYILLSSQQYVVENFEYFETFLNYFEDCYIGRLNNDGARRVPPFGIELWNTYESSLNNMGRTNNAVEGWHNGFSKIVNCAHPSLYQFITFLQTDESYHNFAVQQIQQGLTIGTRLKKYKDLEDRIQRVLQSKNVGDIINYLKRIAYNLTI